MDHPYLDSQLFAYIGNKRALLPFLHEEFAKVAEQTGQTRLRFYDPFAGTGAASRLARFMGMDVHSNDWEYYSQLYNRVYICETRESAESLFKPFGGLAALLGNINARGRQAAADGLPADVPAYISAFYAPPETDAADYRRHRLFYTAENARFIDYVRHVIAVEFPDRSMAELLTALLLYQAGTHANTSGVFKAYHRGFGGLGGDALKRIMHPMELAYPALPSRADLPDDQHCWVTGNDATGPSGQAYDLVYLDPPYNGHQYGSNYFMLNSIARWDKPPVDQSRGDDGRFRKKAAIRPDWVKTRSDFCYSSSASNAFRELLSNLDAPRILLSYNTEGIIPFDELTEIMAGCGKLSIHTREYTTYRGGRQSNGRKVRNMEFILSLDRRKRTSKNDLEEIRRISASRRLERLTQASFDPQQVPVMNHHTKSRGSESSARLQIGGVGDVRMPFFFEFSPEAREAIKRGMVSMDIETIEELGDQLEEVTLPGHIERSQILVEIIESRYQNGEDWKQYADSLLWSLKKFAFRKYADDFRQIVQQIKNRIDSGKLPDFSQRLGALELRVARRIAGSSPRTVRETAAPE